MAKNRYFAIFICLMALLSLSAGIAMAEDYIKNIEIGESDIKFDKSELPHVAYLYVELKNNGDKKISNLNIEISYYDTEGYFMEKSLVKNALNEAIPKEKTRKYKIPLKGDIVNIEHEQYPYARQSKVGEFDIKITGVKFASK
jgi:hypothetical protein